MPKFRKKPVIVEAEQWFPGIDILGVQGTPEKPCACYSIGGPFAVPHIHTTHKGQAVLIEPGDWIIAEPNGNGYYPCKPDIFANTYEAVE